MDYVTMDMKQKIASYREFWQLYQRCYVKMEKALGPILFIRWMLLLIHVNDISYDSFFLNIACLNDVLNNLTYDIVSC